MENDDVINEVQTMDIEITERDIQFECTHCENIIIVDKDGAGLTLTCPHCSEPIVVPPYTGITPAQEEEPVHKPSVPKFDFSALEAEEIKERGRNAQGRLKENQSQRTEIQSYINKATIDLHRWELRMKKLNTKMEELNAEIKALQEALLAKQ